MKGSNEPVSAFKMYSEKLKQKKSKKPIESNRVNKLGKRKPKNSNLNSKQMQEIGNILLKLSEKSNAANNDITNGLSEPVTYVKRKNFNEIGGLNKMCVINKKKKHILENNENTEYSSKNIIRVDSSNKRKVGRQQAQSIKVHKGKLENASKINLEIEELFPVGVTNEKNKKLFSLLVSASKEKTSSEKKKPINLDRQSLNSCKKLKLKKKIQLDRALEKHVTNPENAYTNNINIGLEAKRNSFKGKNTKIENQIAADNSLSVRNKRKKSIKNKSDFTKKKLTTERNGDWTNQENSILAAKCLFEWLVLPVPEKHFMHEYWEKQPLLIQREGNRNYFSALLSTPAIDSMLRENIIQFTKHLDVTSYTDGVRETHNLSGRAQANVVWDFYSNGCSVRLLNPQAFIPKIHALNATLQEYFGCFIGANVYLTPPNSQGFAPHYDDIEAFVLQIEGKKHWKVYPPRNDNETLPRFSSPNFTQEEIGKPFLDVILEPGDMLYFPRGFIHQASTVEGEHSLHITLSAYQKTAWVDLLEKVLPIALKRAAAEDVDFRRGLPRNYLDIEHHGNDADKSSFMDTTQKMMSKLNRYVSLSLGAGVDKMGAQFMHDALPPMFTSEEKSKSGLNGGLKMKEYGKLVDRVEFQIKTKVKLIRANVCRLVEEEDEVRLYHCLDNPLEYHAEEPQFLVLPQEGIPVITSLAKNYPTFTEIRLLPHEDEEALLTLVSDLWDAGLLVAETLSTTNTKE